MPDDIVIQRKFRVQKCSIVFGAACMLATVAPSAMAAEEAGWYLGAGVGQSTADIDRGEHDSAVVALFQSAGARVLSGVSNLDKSDTSYSALVGYRINQYVAVEGSYQKLGRANYAATGTVDPPGAVSSAPSGASVIYRSKGFTLGGVGNLPLGASNFDLHARAGVYFAESTADLAVSFLGGSLVLGQSATTQEFYLGVGAGVKFAEKWRVGLDWTRFANVGDENDTGEANIDNIGLSLTFHF